MTLVELTGQMAAWDGLGVLCVFGLALRLISWGVGLVRFG